MNYIEYLLCTLGEEGGEVGKACSKAMRFGLADRHPHKVRAKTNRRELIGELNDLLGVAEMLVQQGVLPANWQSRALMSKKIRKVEKYARYARQRGTLE